MANRSWSRTIDIVCHDFPAGTLPVDIAKAVNDFFVNTYPDFKVVSIQQCPGFVARVTFDRESRTARQTIIDLGELTIDGVVCYVLRPEPPPPRTVNVLLYQYPFEFSNEPVTAALGRYGEVRDVGFQTWTNMPNVCTGTRLVRMVVTKDIPRFIFIRGFRCKVWYRDQPLTCDICKKIGHKASACPDKGKCLRCHLPGHISRHCPTPWGGAAARVADGDAPVVLDPAQLPPPGDLTHGLQHAEDLDAGFVPLQSAVPESDDHVLADAASVAEAVENAVLERDEFLPSDSSSVEVDLRLNQLDELQSEPSQSILTNCGLGAAPPGGELSVNSQIDQIDLTASNEPIPSNCGPDGASSGGEFSSCSQINSSIDSESNLSNENSNVRNEKGILREKSNLSLKKNKNKGTNKPNNNNSNVDRNYYGSAVSLDDAPLVTDAEMTQASDPRKRVVPETSSDDGATSKSKKVMRRANPLSAVASAVRGVSARASARK